MEASQHIFDDLFTRPDIEWHQVAQSLLTATCQCPNMDRQIYVNSLAIGLSNIPLRLLIVIVSKTCDTGHMKRKLCLN